MKLWSGSSTNYYLEVINLLDNPDSGKEDPKSKKETLDSNERSKIKEIECDLRPKLSKDVRE